MSDDDQGWDVWRVRPGVTPYIATDDDLGLATERDAEQRAKHLRHAYRGLPGVGLFVFFVRPARRRKAGFAVASGGELALKEPVKGWGTTDKD